VIRNETEVLNLKTRKTHVPLEYLTLNFWMASKVYRCANSRAYLVAKWTAFYLVFGSIPDNLPFLSSLRIIESGKDPSL
jgi:hypothetical protein